MVWAAVVGALGGVASVVFRHAVGGIEWVFTQQHGDLVAVAYALSPWQRVAIPAFGGLLAGGVLHFGMRRFGDRRTTDYMEAITLADGKLPLRASLTESTGEMVGLRRLSPPYFGKGDGPSKRPRSR